MSSPSVVELRPAARGKFLYVGEEKFHVKGVTYGPFRPGAQGEYHGPASVEADFALMARYGVNAIRLYTVPPAWLLDAAQRNGLRVMLGLPWEQHVAFLDDARRVQEIQNRVRDTVRQVAGHPAVFCYAIGNEIPAPIVRWHGRQRIQSFLHQLYLITKQEDPTALVTYVNYPSTEYLQLPFLDLLSFNVFLERQAEFEAYLARLQHTAGDRPLLISELGLDSLRNGEQQQAQALQWQLRSTASAGATGAFVFAWTDEWHRGGCDIDDWDFGLTTRRRQPKPALESVRNTFEEQTVPRIADAPRVSVVVCTYNGNRTIGDCLEGLRNLDYPNFEVIVVDDGSTNDIADIVRQYDVRLIRTENRGLSSARNSGLLAATGQIVAYIDDDAQPDPHWLRYLVATMLRTNHAAMGGPNIAPGGDGFIADCVAHAPGGPIHVMLTDEIAEHIPGCNMAFWRDKLLEVGGFDPQFRIAGDDVDLCWRLQKKDWTIGFSPAAMVWHHRRNSLYAYWRQQFNYGKAEGMLERKWPQKYNALGHPAWAGRVYGGVLYALGRRVWRVYHGTWGTAAFQSLYQTAPATILELPTTPEWYVLILLLSAASVVGFVWPPMLIALPLALLAASFPLLQATACARRALNSSADSDPRTRLRRLTTTAGMHLLQPAARLLGRMSGGLTPWRSRSPAGLRLPRPRSFQIWSERWRSTEDRLHEIEHMLREYRPVVCRGGVYDRWDLEIKGGLSGAVRLGLTTEEHGAGRQLIRVRAWPRVSHTGTRLLAMLLLLSCGALLNPALAGCLVFGIAAALLLLVILHEQAVAMGAVARVLQSIQRRELSKIHSDPKQHA